MLSSLISDIYGKQRGSVSYQTGIRHPQPPPPHHPYALTIEGQLQLTVYNFQPN